MKYIVVILCLVFASCMTTKTINLDKMNELKREKALTKIAVNTVNKYASDFYSENLIQKIDTLTVKEGVNISRKLYIVSFFENEKRIKSDWYSFKVYVWADTSKACDIYVETGLGVNIEEAEKSGRTIMLHKTSQPKGWGQ
ncbi:MAG: hypothetical protein PHR83_11040 [Paludibacter sp.]|nr:hypothetical protein [Paludibacter sp.]